MTIRRIMLGASAVCALVLAGPSCSQETGATEAGGEADAAAAEWVAGRTSWGDPDLRGVWPLDLGRTPMQRPAQYGTQAFLTDEEYVEATQAATDLANSYEEEDAANRIDTGHWFEWGRTLRQTSLIMEPENGRIPPMTEEGQARAATMKSSWTQDIFDAVSDFNSLDRCITRGLPASMIPFPYNNGVRVFQAPGYVALNLEMIHETRIIPLDGRPTLPAPMQHWMGESRGHWEGDTLVIETTDFNGGSPMVIVGPSNDPVPTSPSLRIVERLTPAGPDTIQYEAWVEDPEVLTAPFKLSFPWTRNEDYGMFEYACHEGNTVVRNFIEATSPRFADARAEGLLAED